MKSGLPRILAGTLVWVLGLAWEGVAAPEGGPLAGKASWYGEAYRGRRMANGRPFDPDRMTAASWFHPLGSRLRVSTGAASVIVEITDRGPARRYVRRGRTIDLSRAAFARLAGLELGLIECRVARVSEAANP